MSTIQVEKLTKDFGDEKGIFDLDFELNEGEIVGFIGPNGAGKSTTLNILNGFIKPDSGKTKFFKKEKNWLNIHQIYPEMGILPSEVSFDPILTPRQIFKQNQALLGENYTKKWTELAENFNLDLNKQFYKLSFGNKKKVGIIVCLMHNPKIILMDEPTSGLDPLVQRNFLNVLNEYKEEGATIFLSSHVLSEVESVCDRIIMIKKGKIILNDLTKNILEKSSRVFRLQTPSNKILANIENKKIATKIETEGTNTLIYTDEYEKLIDLLVGYQIYNFFIEQPNLEQMFLEFYK